MSKAQTPKLTADTPIWHVPLVLGILMVSAGAFFMMLAHGISVLSSVN